MHFRNVALKPKLVLSGLCVIAGLLFQGTQAIADVPIDNTRESIASKTEISGVLMLDYSLFNGVYRKNFDNNNESNSELRRARIALKHRLNKDWQAKLQISFDEDDNSVEIDDAYVRYKGIRGIDLTFGQMKEPFGLENLTSSKNTTFLERSMASNAFAPGRNKGVTLAGSRDTLAWEFGAYDIDSVEKNTDPYAFTGRLSWAPLRTQTQTIHLGIAGSWRDLDQDLFEINERAEVHTAEKIISSGEIATDNVRLLGMEAAWVNGPLSIQSEYMSADLQAVDASEDAVFDGYYLQTSYFLTGESRRYENGTFKKIEPFSSSGAWELAARYSVLNTREAAEGAKGETTTLGLNYYFDDHVKVMANLLHSEVSDEDDGNALSFRIQYVF